MPSFPRFQKQWQEPVSIGLPVKSTATLQNAAAAVAMNSALISLPANPWILKGCSDGVSANTSGINLWIDETDIVAATSGAHSWAWWRHPSGLEIVVDFKKANNQNIDWVYSPSGAFTGGSVTARPTAIDEQVRDPNAWFLGNNVGRCRLNISHTTDGRITYAFILYHGIVVSAWLVGDAQPHHGSWSPSTVACIQGSAALTSTGINDTTWFKDFDIMFASMAGGQAILRWTTPYCNGQMLDVAQSDRESRTGKWQCWSIGLVCLNTPRKGRHGRMIDLFRVARNTPRGWVYRSDDGAQALLSVGSGYAVPWSPDAAGRVF